MSDLTVLIVVWCVIDIESFIVISGNVFTMFVFWKHRNRLQTSFLLVDFRPPPFFFRLLSNAFSDLGSVGRKRKKRNKKKMEKESYPWSLETTRRGYKVNMAAMEEGKSTSWLNSSENSEEDEPPKLYGKKLPMFRIRVTFV